MLEELIKYNDRIKNNTRTKSLCYLSILEQISYLGDYFMCSEVACLGDQTLGNFIKYLMHQCNISYT